MESPNTQQLQTEENLNTADLDVVTENDVVSEVSALELEGTTDTNEIEINEDVIDQEATETTVQLPGKQLSNGCLVNGKWVPC